MFKTAGVISELHDVVRDKVREISKGDDAEAASMADIWFDVVEETNFEDVNFNKDVYEKLKSKKAVPADMSYFTFRNHFITKVLEPIQEAVLAFLTEKDSSLKRDKKEMDWISGFLDHYVTVASTNRVAETLRQDFYNRQAELEDARRWAKRFPTAIGTTRRAKMHKLAKELYRIAAILKVADGIDDAALDDMLGNYVVVDPETGEEERVKIGTLVQDSYGDVYLEYEDLAGDVNYARYESGRKRFIKKHKKGDPAGYHPIDLNQKNVRENTARYLYEGVPEFEKNFGYMKSALDRFADLITELGTYSYNLYEAASDCQAIADSAAAKLATLSEKVNANTPEFARKIQEFRKLQGEVENAIREAEISNATCGKLAIRVKNVIIVATRKIQNSIPGGRQVTEATPRDWNQVRQQPTAPRGPQGPDAGWAEDIGKIPANVNFDKNLKDKAARVEKRTELIFERLDEHREKLVILKHELQGVTYIFRDMVDQMVKAIADELVGNPVGAAQRKDINFETKSRRDVKERDKAKGVTSSVKTASWLSEVWDAIKGGFSKLYSFVARQFRKLFGLADSSLDLVQDLGDDVADLERFVETL